MPLDFDRMAESFDRTRNSDPRMLKAVARAVTDLLGPGSRILDIGAGTGRFLAPLNGEGLDGYGLDISRGMLLKARSKGLRNLLQGDATRLPFRDGAFDAVFATNILHLVADWKTLVRESCRVSRSAVISVDIGRHEGDPYSVFRSIMREKGHAIPKTGPFETELAEACVPAKRIRLGTFDEVRSREEFLSAFADGTFTFQAGLSEEQRSECMEEMARRYDSDPVRIEWATSLIVWDPEELSRDSASITFCYP